MKRAAHTGYYLPIAEIKDCNVKIDGLMVETFLINQ